jgi:hypothetical protein
VAEAVPEAVPEEEAEAGVVAETETLVEAEAEAGAVAETEALVEAEAGARQFKAILHEVMFTASSCFHVLLQFCVKAFLEYPYSSLNSRTVLHAVHSYVLGLRNVEMR